MRTTATFETPVAPNPVISQKIFRLFIIAAGMNSISFGPTVATFVVL